MGSLSQQENEIRVCGGVENIPYTDELSLDKLEFKVLTWTEIPKTASGGRRKTRRSKTRSNKTR